MKIKVAGVQMACGAERDENISRAARLGAMAVDSGAALVCFQPFPTSRWFPRAEDPALLELAEPEDGPSVGSFRDLARRLGVVVVVPLYELAGERRFYTAFVIDPQGDLVGRYRKVHLPDIPLWRERFYFDPGDTGYPVFEAGGLSFGVQLCWDNLYPEGARALALRGASLILAPTAAAFRSHRKWETVMAATATVNGVYLMRVNRVGSEDEQDFYGRSFCVDPDGEFVIGPIGLRDGVVVAELDSDRIAEVRAAWNLLAGRRPETYGSLAGGP